MGGLDEQGAGSSSAASGDSSSTDAAVHRPGRSTPGRTSSGLVRVCRRRWTRTAPGVAGACDHLKAARLTTKWPTAEQANCVLSAAMAMLRKADDDRFDRAFDRANGPAVKYSRALLGHRYRRQAAHGDAQWRNQHGSRLGDLTAQQKISLAVFECPRQDSNLRSRLRRPLLSPLSYGGSRTGARLPAQRAPASRAQRPGPRPDQDHLS